MGWFCHFDIQDPPPPLTTWGKMLQSLHTEPFTKPAYAPIPPTGGGTEAWNDCLQIVLLALGLLSVFGEVFMEGQIKGAPQQFYLCLRLRLTKLLEVR